MTSDDEPKWGWDVPEEVFKRCLLFLFLIGLIVRAGYLVEHAQSPSFGVLTLDQKYYDGAARALLAGGDLRQLRGLRPLLYPMFLAVIYKVGGAHGIDCAIVVQHFLGVLTGLLVAVLGARLFRNRLAGLLGGLLYLHAALPLAFEGELLIEPMYVFLICLGLLVLLHAAEAERVRAPLWWLLAGALMALTAQARANILAFLLVFPLLAAWRWWQARLSIAWPPLLGLVGALAMAVPWGFVNKTQSGHFQMIPSAGGVNLYLGNKRGADGMTPEQGRRVTYGEGYQDSVEVWAREEYESAMRSAGRVPEDNPMAVSKYWTARALAEIKADPGAWLRLMARKSWLMLWNKEVPNNKAFAFQQEEFLWLRLLPVRWVVLLMLAPAGIWAASKWGNRDALFILLAYAVIYSAGNVAFFVCDRYRYPVWPLLAVIGGGGLLAILDTIHRKAWGPAFVLLAGVAAALALSLPNWFDAKLPSFARDYLFRSIAWYEKGHFPEALRDIDHSLELDPNEVTALQQRGNVLLALERYDDARRDYERTLKLDSDDAAIWNDYGVALEGTGRTNDAAQAFGRAIACHPPSVSAFLGLTMLQIKAARFTEADRTLDELARVEQGPDAIALALRSVVEQKQGNAAQAGELEKQAQALDPAAAEWALKQTEK